MWRRKFALLATCALAACGSGGAPSRPSHAPRSAAPSAKHQAAETPCRELQTRAAARRLALELDYLLIAPEHEKRRAVVGTLANSLYETCRQPKLPGVADPADYRPVRPVIAEIQRDYDEEEIAGH